MKKLILIALAFAFLLAFLVAPPKAQAYTPVMQQTITSLQAKQAIVHTTKPPVVKCVGCLSVPATMQLSYHIPPITCRYATTCHLAYYGNGALPGYWMANNGGGWLRITAVYGHDWDNDHVAPLSCPAEDSCQQDHYYNAVSEIGYLMGRNTGIWVRESAVTEWGD